jgi:hypothetical protein
MTMIKFLTALALIASSTFTLAHATGPDGCAVLTEAASLYTGMSTKSAVVAKLKAGDRVFYDAAECKLNDDCFIEGWTHIGNVTRLDGNNISKRERFHRGWIETSRIKFTTDRTCDPWSDNYQP